MTDSRSQTAANSNTVETSFSCPTSAYTHPHPAVPAQTVRRRRRVRWSAIIDMIPVCFWAGEMVIQRSAFVLFQFRPSPIALEPCADQKAAVLSLLIRLPSGTLPYTPPGQSGKIPHRLPSYKHITFIWITLKQKGKIIFFLFCFLRYVYRTDDKMWNSLECFVKWKLILLKRNCFTGLAIASTLVSLGSYTSRKNNVTDSRDMTRSIPKAKTPPTLTQLPWNRWNIYHCSSSFQDIFISALRLIECPF